MDPEIALLIAVAEQMPMHAHIVELVQAVKERAAEREGERQRYLKERELAPQKPQGSQESTGETSTAAPKPGEEQTSS